MKEVVLHIWEQPTTWEVRVSDELHPLSYFRVRQDAIDWCNSNAEDLGASVIFVWDAESEAHAKVMPKENA